MTEAEPDNPRGIPAADFIDDVGAFLAAEESGAEECLQKWNERYQKYKLMEGHLTKQKADLKKKVPDIGRALEMVRYLQERSLAGEEVSTHFQLTPNVYANAVLQNPQTVGLWLGANVLMEYPFDEAIELLEKNKAIASGSLTTLAQDVNFLRDQITTTEVNIARIYNHDVLTRRTGPSTSSA